MKTIRFYVWMLLAALAGVAFTACEDDKPDPKIIDPLLESHFDIWVSIGENAGMGSAGTLLVQNTKSLDAKEQINFVNTGADVTAKLFQESIIKGAYYYQVPKKNDRFGKYQIVGNEVRVIKEFRVAGPARRRPALSRHGSGDFGPDPRGHYRAAMPGNSKTAL